MTHGAAEDILYDSHPHIGTNKLPTVVAALRESILGAGGQVLFDTKVVDFLIRDGQLKGIVTQSGEQLEGIGVVRPSSRSV